MKPLPCPFCGHEGLMFSEEGSTYRWASAYCERCGATTGETRKHDGWETDAVRAWNTRCVSGLAVIPEHQFHALAKACECAESAWLACAREQEKDAAMVRLFGEKAAAANAARKSLSLAKIAAEDLRAFFFEEAAKLVDECSPPLKPQGGRVEVGAAARAAFANAIRNAVRRQTAEEGEAT